MACAIGLIMPIKDVHTEHCCSIHGCKYGDPDCTVTTGKANNSFPCEICYESQHYYAMAYATPMPPEDRAEQYKQALNKLITTIQNLKGITTEVKQLKELVATIHVEAPFRYL